MSSQPNTRSIEASQFGWVDTQPGSRIEALNHPLPHPEISQPAADEQSHVIHSTFSRMGKEGEAPSVSACNGCTGSGSCQQGRYCHQDKTTNTSSTSWLLIVAASLIAAAVLTAHHLLKP